ncbi:MAG: hypothetical protein NVS2B2_37790 [Ktedonobacteraceae bacterium]
MTTFPNRQKLQGVVAAFHNYIQQQGWSILNEKVLQNGLQFIVTDGLTRVSVDCFTNGNALIQGPLGTLRTELQKWWKQQKESATSSLQNTELPSSIRTKVEAFRSFASNQGWSIVSKSIHNRIYQLRLTSEGMVTPINFYPTGTVLIQGNFSKMKQALEEWWKQQQEQHLLPLFWEEALPRNTSVQLDHVSSSVNTSTEKPIARRIGIQEAGKDDYFGPLVVVGVYVDDSTEPRLLELGVRDSKWLPDNIITSLAEEIKEICRGQGYLLVYRPERYNQLYQETSSSDLLRVKAYAHVIANLQKKCSCEYAVINSFDDESLVPHALQSIGCQLPLKQGTRTFDDISIATAYIIARAEFVQQISVLSQRVGVSLPKGNSNPDIIAVGREITAQGGRDALSKVAKLHFEITEQFHLQ